jgi:hypothetical protein
MGECSGLTEMEVRLQFATEEVEEAKKGVPALHEVTPSSFITAGLELEDEQCVIILARFIELTAV